MSYSADSFSAGEQPTTAKWNKLWANDASFNDGTGITNLEIGSGHTAIKNDYKFSAYRAGALNTTSSTFTTIVFDTKLFDTGTNYSTTTGLFTAPIAGFYQFSAVITTGALTRLFLSFLKNGVEYSRGTDLQSGTGGVMNAVFIQLALGDTVSVQYFASGVVAINNTTLTQFSGYLVSTT